jgi:hypothetical protein
VAKKVGNLLKYLESVLHRAEVRLVRVPHLSQLPFMAVPHSSQDLALPHLRKGDPMISQTLVVVGMLVWLFAFL